MAVKYEGRQEILEYDLIATAERAQLSIISYVSLSLSLYIWTGALVKGLGLEIEKVLVSSGLNKPTARAVAGAIALSSLPQASGGIFHDKGTTRTAETTLYTSSAPHPGPSLVTPRPLPTISSTASETASSHECYIQDVSCTI